MRTLTLDVNEFLRRFSFCTSCRNAFVRIRYFGLLAPSVPHPRSEDVSHGLLAGRTAITCHRTVCRLHADAFVACPRCGNADAHRRTADARQTSRGASRRRHR